MSAFDPKRTSGPSFYALSAACGFHCDLRMRVTVIRSNMPAFVKGSPAEKASASERVCTLMMNRLPVAAESSSVSARENEN